MFNVPLRKICTLPLLGGVSIHMSGPTGSRCCSSPPSPYRPRPCLLLPPTIKSGILTSPTVTVEFCFSFQSAHFLLCMFRGSVVMCTFITVISSAVLKRLSVSIQRPSLSLVTFFISCPTMKISPLTLLIIYVIPCAQISLTSPHLFLCLHLFSWFFPC